MSKESQMLKTDLNHYIQILKDCLELQKKYYTYLQMSIFKDIPQKMMSEYYGIAKNWTAFPNLSEPWKFSLAFKAFSLNQANLLLHVLFYTSSTVLILAGKTFFSSSQSCYLSPSLLTDSSFLLSFPAECSIQKRTEF